MPVIEWVQLGFAWFLFTASIVAWVATSGKTENRLLFWLVLAAGWACFGTVQILIVSQTMTPDQWEISAISIGGWVLLSVAIVSSIWTLSEERFY